MGGARIEQGWGRAHEIKAGEQLIELDGPRFAVQFVQSQPHGDAHEKCLGHFNATTLAAEVVIAVDQEVTVVECLDAKVIKLQVTAWVECLSQLFQVKAAEFFVQKANLDALLDESWEVLTVTAVHLGLRDLGLHDLLANGVQQQTGANFCIGGVLFNECTGRQDGGLQHFFDGHAVVDVFQGVFHDGIHTDSLAKVGAGRSHDAAQPSLVQRLGNTVDQHVKNNVLSCSGIGSLFCGPLLGAFLGTTFAIQHIGSGHFMFARAHQTQFDLVLDVFNMQGAAGGEPTYQGCYHLLGQLFGDLAHPGGCCTLIALHGQEGLGHSDLDLAGLEAHNRAIAANDLDVGETGLR